MGKLNLKSETVCRKSFWLATIFLVSINFSLFSEDITPGGSEEELSNLAIGSLKQNYSYPVAGVARYYFVAPTKKGEQAHLKITLRDDLYTVGEEVYLIFTPYNKGTMLDVYILKDWKIYSRVFMPYDIKQLMVANIDEVMESASRFVDWELVLPSCRRNYYRRLAYMILVIENRLPLLAEDTSLANTLGFAKWVIDGLYIEKMGKEIPLTFLNQKAYDQRGGRHVLVFEESQMPFLTLDWSRNLSLAVELISNPHAKYGDMDVNYLPQLKHNEDTGYAISELERALYLLAVKNPNSFFLGSISQTDQDAKGIRRHTLLPVFFPRIDYNGKLTVEVFESGKKIDLQKLVSDNGDAQINLVEIPANDSFAPGKYQIYSVLKR